MPSSLAAPSPAIENENDEIELFPIVAAVSLEERHLRTLKHGDTFAVFDRNGDASSNQDNPEGIYHKDTRHLSRLAITIGGKRPLLLGSTLRDDNAVLTCDLTNPDLEDADGNVEVVHDRIHLRRSCFLWNGACFERILVRNFGDRARRIRITVHFETDFADLFEVRGAKRPARGLIHEPVVESDRVRLSYTGLDGVQRETNLRFHPLPSRLRASSARFDLDVEPNQSRSVLIEIDCGPVSARHTSPARYFTSMRDARRALRRLSSKAAAIATSNELFNETVRRAVSDLYTLVTDLPGGPYPYAGVPWFSTIFGRDAIITAFETLWIDPGIARGVLSYLAANQAEEVIPAADAEPGKILHEVRQGEMAELGEVPFRRYYGSVDSTPLFVMLAGAHYQRTGDLETARQLWPNIEAALGWIDTYGDRDGDGFVEYGRATGEGLVNQGWKDSNDSVFHADGSIASGPIAICEVQAYVYGAWMAAAALAQALGQEAHAAQLRGRAEDLQRRFDQTFFDEELGTYVLALDGHKQPCRIRASNAGHALFTGIAFAARASSVVARLMEPSSFSGWGVRTVASTAPRYNPMSYHNGSVWPHDNAILAAGFARYGYRAEVVQILEGLFAASSYLDLRRLPELFCGFPRKRSQGPTSYPVACSPQAWAAVAPLSLLQSCLGISFDPARGLIMLDRPALPEVLDEVQLTRLALGDRYVDLELRRAAGGEVTVNVLRRQGHLRVLTIS
jgi:glycogen debranching enzyme